MSALAAAGLVALVALPAQAGATSAHPAPAPRSAVDSSNAVVRTPASSTLALVNALAPLESLSLTTVQADIAGAGRFPVAGLATYSDDWLEYRATPTPHLHEGIDIVAALGTPIISPTDGTLKYSTTDPDGYGLTAIVIQPDGTYYVMAHMSAIVKGLTGDQPVHVGQVIGFVGDSGDATGPHCHFEVHPHGGPGIDGKPLLDQWLAQAVANAPNVIARFQQAAAPSAPPAVQTDVALPVIPAIFPSAIGGTRAPSGLQDGALVALHRSPSPGPGSWTTLALFVALVLLGASVLMAAIDADVRRTLARGRLPVRRLASWGGRQHRSSSSNRGDLRRDAQWRWR
ncbi:MAG: M23 family metallopeptidase [Acidimicrobiales bacterium]